MKSIGNVLPLAQLGGKKGVSSLELAEALSKEHDDILHVIHQVDWVWLSVRPPVPCLVGAGTDGMHNGFALAEKTALLLTELVAEGRLAGLETKGS